MLSMPPVPRAVREARRWVRETLTRWRLGELTESAEQIASELVTNAIRHAHDGPSVSLRLTLAAGTARIDVGDHDPRNLPQSMSPAPADEAGHGLVIVEALSDRWGVTVTGPGKSVWSELDAGRGEATGQSRAASSSGGDGR